MRIVVWNCAMALHRKWELLLSLRPDVAIIPECANPAILQAKMPLWLQQPPVWIGDRPNKGLGVFAFGDYRARLADNYNPQFRWLAPVEIAGPQRFNVLGVWAFNGKGDAILGLPNRERGPLLAALDAYESFVTAEPTIVGGDFNNHLRWDKPGKPWNHASAVERLGELGLISAYHHARGVAQGEEPEPTHYWRDRKPDGQTYHLDYCFVPEAWLPALESVEVGICAEWVPTSDQDPIVLTMSDERLLLEISGQKAAIT